MTPSEFTPEQSLGIITKTIQKTRASLEENGFIYMFWGGLVALASLSQYFLLKNGHMDIHFYPYFLMPLGAVFTWLYFSKKPDITTNQFSRILTAIWIVLSLNLLIVGFILSTVLREHLIPVLLMLLSLGISLSGVIIKSRMFVYAGILINVSAFVCFLLPWDDQPLLMGLIALVSIFGPGLKMHMDYKRRSNVARA